MVRKRTSVWKGTISFGLVNINVQLYSAVKQHSLGFTLLHSKCHTPIHYKRICNYCNEEVEWADVVKGIKLPSGDYFIMTKEKIDELRPEKSDNITIIEFVPEEAIDPIYFEQSYYVAPARITDRAFFLFDIALEKSNMVAIGQFVMRDKQYVCAIRPYNQLLLLTTLNYSYEIQSLPIEDKIKVPKFTASELNLANELIDKLATKKFDMSKFKDTFAQQILERIKKASKGKIETKKPKLPKKKEKDESHDTLMQALRKSIKTKVPLYSNKTVARAKSK